MASAKAKKLLCYVAGCVLAVTLAIPTLADTEEIVVTAYPALSSQAQQFYKTISGRLNLHGKSFVTQEVKKIALRTQQIEAVYSDAERECALSFKACRSNDGLALASYIFAEAAYGIDAPRQMLTQIDKAAFEAAYKKAAGSAGFDPSQKLPPNFQLSLLANLPAKDRDTVISYQARQNEIRVEMQRTLKVLGIPNDAHKSLR
jgi:hypothetical protein